MKYYILAVPVFNADMEVEAYSLKSQDIDKIFGLSHNYMRMDGVMHSPVIDILNSVGIEPFTGGKPVFIELNKFGLLTEVYKSCKLPSELMVYVLDDSMPDEEIYIENCRALKESGSLLAIPASDTEPPNIMNMADFIIISASEKYYDDRMRVTRLRYPRAKILVTDVANIKGFESVKTINNAIFEGRFYTRPITRATDKVSPLKANAIHLLKYVSEEDFDLEDVSKIIEQDIALSISLLKFINSPAVGIPSRVNSIKNAVALLGQRETRKWVTVAVSTYIAADKPNEITRLSLIRAKFAECLANHFELGIHASSLFLMGLFSLLDVILDKPMIDAINEVSLNENIKKALVYRKGPFQDVLSLIYSFEQADWKKVQYIVLTNNVDPYDLSQAFIDTLIWYRKLLDSLQ